MTQLERRRIEIARTLRFLRTRDLLRIERVVGDGITMNDFIGARCVDDLPTRALKIVRMTSVQSPMLAAMYLRELLPPTSLERLLPVVDRLLAEVPPVWRLPRTGMNHDDLARLEELLGRPLVPEDFEVATSLETLTPHVHANARRIAREQPVFAHCYLLEVLPRQNELQGPVKRFVSQLWAEGEAARGLRDDPVDN